MENGEIVEEGDMFDIFALPKKEITKDFINTTSSLSKIYDLIEEKSPIVELEENEKILKEKATKQNVTIEEYIKKVCIYDPWLKEYEG